MPTFEERTETRLNDHANRIRALENSDARKDERLDHLCAKLDTLISWLKALLIAWVTGMGGFLLWYIKSLPR